MMKEKNNIQNNENQSNNENQNNENRKNRSNSKWIGRLGILIVIVILLLWHCHCCKTNEKEETELPEVPTIELPNSEESDNEASEEESSDEEESDGEDSEKKAQDIGSRKNANKDEERKEGSKTANAGEQNPSNPSQIQPTNNPNQVDPSQPTQPTDPEKPTKKKITKADVEVKAPQNLVYDGTAKKVTVKLKNGVTANVIVTYAGDSVTDGKAIAVGKYTATVTVVGTGNYTGRITKTVAFEIVARTIELTESDVTVALPENLTFDGNIKEVTVNVKDGVTANVIVTYAGDSVTNGKAIAVGKYTATVTVVGTGNYTGSITKTVAFEIVARTIALKESDVTVNIPEDLTFDGNVKEVTVDVKDGVTADVIVTYAGNVTGGKAIAVGKYTATVTVVGTGNYTGSITKTVAFEIVARTIALKESDVTVTLPENLTFNGRAKEVTVDVKSGITADVIVTYAGNVTGGKAIAVGKYTATVTVVGTGNYTGSITKTVTFEIVAQTIELTESDVTVTLPENLTFDGNVKEVTVDVKDGVTTNVIVTYAGDSVTDGKAIAVGKYTATVTVVGTGNYTGSITKTVAFEIVAQTIELTESDVTVALPENLTFDGNVKEVTVDVKDGVTANVIVTYAGDSVTDGKAIAVGKYTATVTVVGTGNYTGSITKTVAFEIVARTIELTESDVTVALPENLTFNGRAKEVTVDVKSGITADVIVTYAGNVTGGKAIAVGKYTATVTVVGTGNYTGSITKTVTFEIVADSKPTNPGHGNPDESGGTGNNSGSEDGNHGNPDGDQNQGNKNDQGGNGNPDKDQNQGNKNDQGGNGNPDKDQNQGSKNDQGGNGNPEGDQNQGSKNDQGGNGNPDKDQNQGSKNDQGKNRNPDGDQNQGSTGKIPDKNPAIPQKQEPVGNPVGEKNQAAEQTEKDVAATEETAKKVAEEATKKAAEQAAKDTAAKKTKEENDAE